MHVAEVQSDSIEIIFVFVGDTATGKTSLHLINTLTTDSPLNCFSTDSEFDHILLHGI